MTTLIFTVLDDVGIKMITKRMHNSGQSCENETTP